MRSFHKSLWLRSSAALAFISAGPALAGDIVGNVADASQTRSLQGAQVRIVELNRTMEAARDGSFRFPEVPAGTYTLEASYIGTDPVRMSVTVADVGVARADLLLGTASDVIVVGQFANQASSLSRQRAADGVESVVTRDSIGQLPDQNVAESLRRLPGVNFLNDQGEGRFVSVRGLDPELNAASINGTRVPSPESDVRSVALDVIPSELIESIEVKKTLTPDLDADTIGASIEINTTSAFDRKKDLLSVKLEGSYNDYADALTPKASLDFSTRITDNFGIAGGVSYYKRKFETDNVEASGWATTDDGVTYVEEVQYRDYDVERERLGLTLNLDWRPSDTTKLYARGLYSRFADQEYRADLTFIMDEAPRSGDADNAFFSDEDGRIEVRRGLKDRGEVQKIKSVTLGGETVQGPWRATYSAAWSEASELEDGSLDPTRFRARFDEDGVNVNFDYANPRRPLFTVSGNTALFNDPETYGFNRVERTVLSDAMDREYTLRGDLSREFAGAAGTFTLQTGVKSRWRKKGYDFELEYFGDFDGDYTLADVLGSQSYRFTDLGPIASHTGPRNFFESNRGSFELDPIENELGNASSDYSIKEDVLAGYVLGRWDSEQLRVVGGLRMERTYNEIRAFLTETDGDEVTVTPNRFERSYTDWLPSIAVRYEPARDLILRLGAYKSLVRPKLSNLAPRFLLNEDREAEFGNPDLTPYRAWNADIAAEWYFGKNSALTGGVFWKSIKDFVVEQRDFEPGTAYGIDYTEALTFVNGETAKVRGVELSYAQTFGFLPAPLDGLLLNANYTFTDATGTVFSGGDATDPRNIPLPAASRNMFNVTLGYEKGPISLRAAGTYRDKYLDELGGAADEDRYVTDHFQLDLSAKFRVAPGVRLFADWINLTDAPYYAYQNFGGRQRLLQYEKYNWTAKFGVTASF